jgi:leader peptidase (prepilin peptidase)/N-methyltransferase
MYDSSTKAVKNMLDTLIYIIVFVYGLLIGSFLNVCIYRIPLGKTIVKGRSYCPSCNALIPWYCNIPLFSYLFLRGRCLRCRQKISPVYPALLYLAALYVYGPAPAFLFLAALFSLLIVIAFIDLEHQIIPDGLVITILVLGAFHAVYQVLAQGMPWHLFVIGFLAASVTILILGLVYEGGMGGGDIKLMAAAGVFIGWKLILLSLFIGALYAGCFSLFLVLSKKGSMKTAVPFGPFLSLGIVTCALTGNSILAWYLGLF